MGAHHFDIAQWALDMDNSGPVKIEPPAKGEKGLRFTYANGIPMIHGGEADSVFEGTEGTILASRKEIVTKPESILKQPIGPSDWHVYPSHDHRKNWLVCIKRRKDPICRAETGQRSATICHLANIGYWLRRTLRWDPARERFIGDAEANGLTDRADREPWRL